MNAEVKRQPNAGVEDEQDLINNCKYDKRTRRLRKLSDFPFIHGSLH